ncbi:MAG: hypothetical protein Q9227_007855 [Pyrenula ochraceoflavens]
MPPFLPRKRPSTSPEPSFPRPTKKPKLADSLDAPAADSSSLQLNKNFTLGETSDSSLTDIDEFEDVSKPPPAEELEDVDWEDALGAAETLQPNDDLQLTLSKDTNHVDYASLAAYTTKKGPSKIERQIRIATHRMHVQCLLFHNALRNMWVSDAQVHEILLRQLSPGIKQDVQRWKIASGSATPEPPKPQKRKGRKPKNERDWGTPSRRAEEGKPDVSRGDPLIPLLKVLVADWKKRFRITTPGLRKHGYEPKQVLQAKIASFHNDSHDPEKHGERIRNIGEFRARARQMSGSRDVGAQLFTALLRALGIESRLVANLQPLGFGWTKAEEAVLKTKSTEESKDDSEDEESDASVIEVAVTPKKRKHYDTDLPMPIYWTEAISPISNSVVAVSPYLTSNQVMHTQDSCVALQPVGAKSEKAKQILAYVVGFSADGTAKDVTTRYLKGRRWPGKSKGFRMPIEKLPIYNKRGKILRHEEYDWFKHTMRSYARPKRTALDEVEDSTDLQPQQPEKKDAKAETDTLQSLRSSAEFVLERFLRREEALRPASQHVRTFVHGKGDKVQEEKVFRRDDVVPVKTAESWHKEGRRIKAAEVPRKLAPIRAVTLTRKREVEDEMRETGEKPMQGMYSVEQTEYIIPPPIQNGVIPKNAYGNIDCFVSSMVPKGAVHLPYRGTVKMCKKLDIDFAEAVIGFEFGNKRAVPVIQGVVIAQENKEAVMDALEAYEAEQRQKEEVKQEKTILSLWRKMLMGLRIAERMQDEYGMDDLDPKEVIDLTDSTATAGQQLRNTVPASEQSMTGGGGFLLHDEDEYQPEELVMNADQPPQRAAPEQYPTPASAPLAQTKTRSQTSSPVDSDESAASKLSHEEDQGLQSDQANSPKPKSRKKMASANKQNKNNSRSTRKKNSLHRSKTSPPSATPRRQNPRIAKTKLTSPYFASSDMDE